MSWIAKNKYLKKNELDIETEAVQTGSVDDSKRGTLDMTKDIKNLAFSNWCHVVTLHVYHVSWIIYAYFFFTPLTAANNLTGYCWAALDINLLYAIRTMKLLILPLQHWVKQINLIRFDDEESWNSMLIVHKDLLSAYGTFEETFQILIVFYVIQTTVKTLLAVIIRIELWKVSFGNRNDIEYVRFYNDTIIPKTPFN
ncbi:hypothetical protein HF086_006403 [Spodoptera exigua]|uniref:Gustatory receptor n=1 Tax=Spodoptera exigua TaxID=7107 RepID=A0A922SNN1_SPOEX|nr:hypothetical protein HF086_006403 [Spodoptera exigua]